MMLGIGFKEDAVLVWGGGSQMQHIYDQGEEADMIHHVYNFEHQIYLKIHPNLALYLTKSYILDKDSNLLPMKANSGSNCAQVFGAIGQQKHKVRTAPLGRISLNYKSKGSFCTKFSRKKNTFWSLDIFHPEGEKSCFIHNVFPS